MSDREPSAEGPVDDGDEGLISRFWKVPVPAPTPVEHPPETDRATEHL